MKRGELFWVVGIAGVAIALYHLSLHDVAQAAFDMAFVACAWALSNKLDIGSK